MQYEFDLGFKGYALYITPRGGILVDGVDEQGRRPTDVTTVSHDHGRSWKVENEGGSAQAGYYDAQAGTRWHVTGCSLYKRQIL